MAARREELDRTGPPHAALDPQCNARVFSCDHSQSFAAAARFLGAAAIPAVGAYGLLVEGVPDVRQLCEALSGTLGPTLIRGARASGGRLLVQGPASVLQEAARHLPAPAGPEAASALAAFFGAGGPPPPTLVMGILNVTPDSFSDGGHWLSVDAAVERALQMAEDGAGIIDVGGESSRPGAVDVPVHEELRRVLPVVERLRARSGVRLSVDTRKAEVARACLEAGADMINDVSGLTHDPAIADAVAAHPEAALVLMHQRRKPTEETYSTEYDDAGRPVYEDVVADTLRWLRCRLSAAVDRGVQRHQVWIDPGFGFGKTYAQNLELLRRLREYTSVGLPVLLGTSRKSSVGRLQGGGEPADRLEGSLATLCWGISQGVRAVRVHDVKESARAARAADTLRPCVF